MKWISFPSLAAAGLAMGLAQAQQSDKVTQFARPKAELFSPRFHATGELSLVRQLPEPPRSKGRKPVKEEVIESFGAGALAEERAFTAYKVLSGDAPVVIRRVFRHDRCPQRDRSGTPTVNCDPIKIFYEMPEKMPAKIEDYAKCNVSVDTDVMFLRRSARRVSWVLDPTSPMVTTASGVPIPRFRLLDRGYDPKGEEVRGITFSDNNDFPRQRGSLIETTTGPMFESMVTSADGQRVDWTRTTDQRRRLVKLFYYAVVLQVWSDTLQDYVFCEPYDPTIPNRGN
ncbi:MAG: hypothetical protein KF788_15590 [Piscinibacter sp.]|nr:hypothetical protein [Piscinibacter sp.]